MRDVVVRDRLIDPSVMEYINPEAVIYDVGKRRRRLVQLSRALMTSSSSSRRLTTRWFDSRAETLSSLGAAERRCWRCAPREWRCEVVPGLSSALAGPLAAGIPVTHRGVSRGVAIVSARGEGGELTDFRRLASTGLTLVILMGIEHRRVIAKQLIEGGLEPTTPVAVVEGAWTNQQRTTRADIERPRLA